MGCFAENIVVIVSKLPSFFLAHKLSLNVYYPFLNGAFVHFFLLSGSPNDLLIADSEGRTPLHWAVDRGHLDIVEMLIGRAADVNAKVCLMCIFPGHIFISEARLIWVLVI